MSLDVEVPDPPSLHGPQTRAEYEAIAMTDQQPDDDYRREEIESFLQDGAWQDAFEEWAAHTYLSDEEFEVVREHGLIDQFDFYWDPTTDEVGYRVPTIPEGDYEELSDDDVEGIEEELDSLGRVVSEMLENDYLLRDDDTFGFFDDDSASDNSSEEE